MTKKGRKRLKILGFWRMDNVQLKKQEEKTMRTLKKVLALTVVLATLLSISSFAAFSDEESIDESFVDAVNLLGALNVMTGDTEGTFRPNDTISRAEAAKMIYVIRNGGVDDQAAGWTGMTTFSDVPAGAWYEGYVNYCASLGIIAGVGGGKFNPSGAVTGVELAKMMLVVADYNPNIEGYTGTNWTVNVARRAIERKTGARGLRNVMESVMLDIMYQLPSMPGVKECVINDAVIEKKAPPLYIYDTEAHIAS